MSKKHHQSPRLDLPSMGPAEVAAAEKACEAIAAKCEEIIAKQQQTPPTPPVAAWGDVQVIQRGAR